MQQEQTDLKILEGFPWPLFEKHDINYVYPSDGDRLYHYTSAAGLKGILESGRLWASDSRSLNDTSELSLGLKMALETLRSYDNLEPVRSILEDSLTGIFRDATAFVVCFTTKRDLLSGWRSYGLDGRGYCLGFDIRDMSCKVPYSGFLPVIGKVIYDPAKAKRFLHQVARAYWDPMVPALNRLRGLPEKDQEKEWEPIQRSLNKMVEALAVVCGLIKNESFFEEEEVRALYICNLDTKEIMIDNCGKSVVKARADARGAFIPYAELAFIKHISLEEEIMVVRGDIEKPTPILKLVEIILPPQMLFFERARTGVLALLRQHGYDPNLVKIVKSKIRTYRS